MNKNKIYQKMNHLKINMESYEAVEVSQEEKDKLFYSLTKKIKKEEKQSKKLQPIFATAAVIFLLFIGSQTQIGQKVQATANSIIENIQYGLSQALGNEKTNSSETALSFNQTARVEDAEISIQDMVAFDHRIVFNVLIDLEGPAEEQLFVGFSGFEILVNDQPLETQGLVGIGEMYDEEENIFSAVYSTELTQESIVEEDMHIEMIFQDIRYYDPSDLSENPESLPPIEGVAYFATETTMEELTKHTQVYTIDHFVSTGDYDYYIESLYVHPLLNYIEISSENWGDEDFQLIEIRGEDEKGNTVVFEASYNMNAQKYRRNSFTLSERKSELSTSELANAEQLDLQFYSAGWPEDGMAEYLPYGEAFTIDLRDTR